MSRIELTNRHVRFVQVLLVASLLAGPFALPALAADAPDMPRVSEAEARVHIDGKLDEAIWSTLTPVDNFKVVDPDSYAKPIYKTEARFFYTERGIYVGIWNEIPREHQIARLTARDVRATRDGVFVGIDSSGNGLYGYMLSISLGDALSDSTILPERELVNEWDGPWYGRTSATDDGWYAEGLFPWSMFALPDTGEEREIGIYVSRRVAYLNELWGWPALPRSQPIYISGFHRMPIEGVDPKRQYAIYPFASVTRKRVKGETDSRVGADFFFRPSTGMQLTATINPDFGQVEQDELEVNLTAFETFFPEKRPFFLEGHEIFNTGRNTLVNTRRIGAPNSPPDLPDDAEVDDVDLAEATDLYGAMKMTGQVGSIRYGVMTAFEEDTDYIATSPTGDLRVAVEGSDFYVARMVHEVTEGAYKSVGLMTTVADHADDAARVTALDGKYRSSDGTWEWWGQALRSDTDEKGSGFSGDLNYRPEQGVRHNLQVDWFEEGLDLNDLGFLRRDDSRRFWYQHARERSGLGNVRWRESWFFTENAFNSDGRLTDAIFGIGQFMQFQNYNELRWNFEYLPPRWDDRNSLGNGDFRVHDGWWLELAFATDPAKKWHLFTFINGQNDALGDWRNTAEVQLDYVPSDRFDLHLTLNYTRRRAWLVYLEDRDFTTFSADQWFPRIEANLFLSAQQQVRAVVQWIGVKAKEQGFYSVPLGGGRLQPRVKAAGADPDDFTISSLVFQLRYKWELAPLSNLYVVYTRGGNMSAAGIEDDFGTLLSDTFSDPIAELFVVKLRYRFGG